LEMETDPIVQLELWLDQAIHSEDILNPTAATLATVSKDGQPSARIVLVKSIDKNGLTFYTNYNSQKGVDLHHTPNACLNFYWEPLHRQIKIEGSVTKVSADRSKQYFYSRPKESQSAAAISNQSQPIAKDRLMAQFNQIRAQDTIPFPDHWGGYLVTPIRFEFWQGQPNRLHDRIQYIKHDITPNKTHQQWQKVRIAP
jgi:pyridoxamine-phosphate oxidase